MSLLAARSLPFLVAVLAAAGTTVAWQARVRAPHPIVAGEAWRSAQLEVDELARFVDEHGVRAVLSLRGASARDEDHEAETAWCKANGVRHVQIPLTPTSVPTPAQGRALLRAFDNLPRPLLLHCHRGADRTGLASAAYLALVHGVDVDEAVESQLCLLEGHVGLGRERAMDEWFELWRREADGRTLREWIETRGALAPMAALER